MIIEDEIRAYRNKPFISEHQLKRYLKQVEFGASTFTPSLRCYKYASEFRGASVGAHARSSLHWCPMLASGRPNQVSTSLYRCAFATLVRLRRYGDTHRIEHHHHHKCFHKFRTTPTYPTSPSPSPSTDPIPPSQAPSDSIPPNQIDQTERAPPSFLSPSSLYGCKSPIQEIYECCYHGE